MAKKNIKIGMKTGDVKLIFGIVYFKTINYFRVPWGRSLVCRWSKCSHRSPLSTCLSLASINHKCSTATNYVACANAKKLLMQLQKYSNVVTILTLCEMNKLLFQDLTQIFIKKDLVY